MIIEMKSSRALCLEWVGESTIPKFCCIWVPTNWGANSKREDLETGQLPEVDAILNNEDCYQKQVSRDIKLANLSIGAFSMFPPYLSSTIVEGGKA